MGRIVAGIQPAREAIRARGSALERVMVDRGAGPKLDKIARFAADRGATVERVATAVLDKIAGAARHQGVVVIAPELELASLEDLLVAPGPRILVLDGIMDPQNFGAVVRSAVALGATGVVWAEHHSAPLSPAMFRASAGAVEHAVLCRVGSLTSALHEIGDAGVVTVALDAHTELDLGAIDLRGPVAIVVGAEDRGPRPPVRKACRHVARLPMAGPIDSLNASVAGALALYEIARQRSTPP